MDFLMTQQEMFDVGYVKKWKIEGGLKEGSIEIYFLDKNLNAGDVAFIVKEVNDVLCREWIAMKKKRG